MTTSTEPPNQEVSSTNGSTPTSTSTSPGVVRRHPHAKCEECTLFSTYGSRYAPGEGPEDADLIIIGEAPGFAEAQTGRPFTGPSGRLLDTILEHHGIDRRDAYVTNAVACRPPDNRTPTKSEVAACWPRLRHEIDKRQPSSILCLGNTAAQEVLNTRTGITTLRTGPAKVSPFFEGVSVVPTIHPAYVLRTADAFPTLVADIGKLRPEAIQLSWEEPRYTVFDDETAIEALRQLDPFEEVVVDIEVGIDKDTAFGHSDQYQMLCVGICFDTNRVIIIGEEACKLPEVKRALQRFMLRHKITAHNGKFDLAGLWAYLGGQYGSLHFDTMLASYCVDERPGTHGLKYLAVEELGAPQYDAVLAQYVGKGDSYAMVPRHILYKYCAFDCSATRLLKDMYEPRLEEEGLRELHDFLVEVSNELVHLEMAGLSVDISHLDHLTDHYLDDLAGLEGELRQIVGFIENVKGGEFNPRSPKQVKEWLYGQGVRVQSTDEETLTSLRDKADPTGDLGNFLRLMLLHRREAKLYGTYVKGTRKRLHKGKVHPTFLLHGSVTGRTACRNPNLQNVPRESTIRRLFVPRPGYVYVQGDYSQAELRVICTEAEDEYLRGVLSDRDRDIHGEVATRFFGPGWTKDQRVRAKAVVFGLSYGREAYSLAIEYGWSLSEAQRYLDDFFALIPGVVAWREKIKHQILFEQEDLVSHFGRHRRFWLITEDNAKDVVKEGLAFIPQSNSSDICLNALVRLRRDVGLDVRLPVHDSILVECLEQDAEETAAVMKEVMEAVPKELYTDYVPFYADVQIGKSWGDLS